MLMKKIVRTIWNDLLHLFYPDLCLLCKQPLVRGEEQLCLTCFCDLPRVNPYALSDRDRITCMFADRPEIRHTVAFLYYEKGSVVQRLVHSFKYYGNKKLAFWLGRQMALDLQKKESPLLECDCLLPVPLHWWKKWRRGYNQTEWIARGIQSVWQKPLDTTGLKRIRYGKSQATQTVFERLSNVETAYQLASGGNLQGKRLLLIDDVITTGSTIRACAEALSGLSSASVDVLTLSIV